MIELVEVGILEGELELGSRRLSADPYILSGLQEEAGALDAVYPDDASLIDEATPTAPGGYHGMMHLARELMLRSTVKCPLALLRPSLLYGAGELPARNVANLGLLLYADHLLAVELAGTLLLVATIGAVAIAHRKGVPQA